MAKLTLANGTIIEGTPQELYDISQKFGVKAEEVAKAPAQEITHKGVEYTLVDRKAQEGDVVVFTENTSACAENGITYEVVDIKQDKTVFSDSSGSYNVYSEIFNRTESNTLVYSPKVEVVPTPLKAGDYAVVTSLGMSTGFERSDVSLGDIGEIIEIDRSKVPYRFKRQTDDFVTWFAEGKLTKATDEEVAEAKAQSAKDAIFTQAGRKPNEYRKGDIVRVTLGGYADINEGDIGVVLIDGTTDLPKISVGGYEHYNYVKLVATVESRLDRN